MTFRVIYHVFQYTKPIEEEEPPPRPPPAPASPPHVPHPALTTHSVSNVVYFLEKLVYHYESKLCESAAGSYYLLIIVFLKSSVILSNPTHYVRSYHKVKYLFRTFLGV